MTTTVERVDTDVPPERRAPVRSGWLHRAHRRVARAAERMRGPTLAFRLIMAVFLALIVASYAVPFWYQLRGERLLVVTSGSMEPEIATGSAVVVRPITSPSELRVGQVVTFWPTSDSQLVTHRIIGLKTVVRRSEDARHEIVRDASGNPIMDPYIQTQGDNNAFPDADLTPVGQVRGIVRDVHPGWGYLLAFAHSGPGRFLLFVPPLLLLLGAELMSRVPDRWRRASWNKTLLAIRTREHATGGPLARRDEPATTPHDPAAQHDPATQHEHPTQASDASRP